MLTLGLTGRIYVCVEPQDGRKSFDGLAAVVTARLGRDPLSGDLYVLRNRRGDRLKILAWQGDGFALYLRRLEKGTFAFPTADATEVAASVKRAGVNPWAYLTHLLTELPTRSLGVDLTDLLPDRWATTRADRRALTG